MRIPGVMLSDDNDQTEIIDYDGPVGCLESDIFCVHLEANYGALKGTRISIVKRDSVGIIMVFILKWSLANPC